MYKPALGVRLHLLFNTSHILKSPAFNVGYRSKNFQREVVDARNIAANVGACSLSANQVGHHSSFFLVLGKSRLVANKWSGYKCGPADYEIVVNPSIQKRSEETEVDAEECPSLPGLTFHVQRFKVIRANWKNQQMKDQAAELSGFQARVWQHEIDHLNGTILTDFKVNCGRLQLKTGCRDLTNGQFDQMRREYLAYSAEHPEEGPRLFEKWNRLIQLAKYGIMEPNSE